MIERALAAAGATMADVIRHRVFMTDMALFPTVGAELIHVFRAIRLAGAVIGICAIIDSHYLVEIAVDAIVGSGMPAADAPDDEIPLDHSES